MSKIIRYCKLEEEHIGDNCFDVSRPSIFGNPFTHIKNRETKALVKVSSRDEAVDLYSAYFDKMLSDKSKFGDAFRAEWDRMYHAYKNYDVIYLGCYCHVDKERCHTEILEKKLVQRSLREKVKKIMEERKKTNVSSS